jgi:hypothetical protein
MAALFQQANKQSKQIMVLSRVLPVGKHRVVSCEPTTMTFAGAVVVCLDRRVKNLNLKKTYIYTDRYPVRRWTTMPPPMFLVADDDFPRERQEHTRFMLGYSMRFNKKNWIFWSRRSVYY